MTSLLDGPGFGSDPLTNTKTPEPVLLCRLTADMVWSTTSMTTRLGDPASQVSKTS